MNYFEVDVYRLLKLLLPLGLRNTMLGVMLEAVAEPLNDIYYSFKNYRENNIYRLQVSPQVCYLEKALNDRFDAGQRRIYISDGDYYPVTYIFTAEESINRYIYTNAEDNPVYIYTSGETGSGERAFVVNIPAGITEKTDEIKSFLEVYRLASKKPSIEEIL